MHDDDVVAIVGGGVFGAKQGEIEKLKNHVVISLVWSLQVDKGG